ncbi:MAG: hypothetical protein IJK01_02415 [Clostridia bacterium]|jgi:hypothetical protein|nr:hypothetical protein [Clostridia bacterium]
MPRKTNDKRRILYVRDILERHIGRADAITMAEILSALGTFGITADRKSVYDDLKQLELYGMQIGRTCGGRYSAYYLRR